MTITMRPGYLAQQLLSQNPSGTVMAVFERSAYLELSCGIVCLAAADLPQGPLMVPYRKPFVLRVGEVVRLERVGERTWRPPSPLGWTHRSLERGLSASVVRSDVKAWFENTASGAKGDLSGWLLRSLSGEFRNLPESLARLVGLGPGLTPSGDDYLGGALVVLHTLGHSEIASALFGSLDLSRTNRISAAHLSAASQGAAAAPLHDVLNDVLCGQTESLPSKLEGLDLMGHRSGWDSFAGCHAVLNVCCEAAEVRTAA